MTKEQMADRIAAKLRDDNKLHGLSMTTVSYMYQQLNKTELTTVYNHIMQGSN